MKIDAKLDTCNNDKHMCKLCTTGCKKEIVKAEGRWQWRAERDLPRYYRPMGKWTNQLEDMFTHVLAGEQLQTASLFLPNHEVKVKNVYT